MDGNLLIDTGAFIALLDAGDSLHQEAKKFYHGLSPIVRRVTTQAIIGECYTFFRYRQGAGKAGLWLDYLDKGRGTGHLRLIYTDEEDGRRAEELLRRFRDQDLSYTDSLTLAAADRFGARAIFGFDRHLTLTGLPLLPGNR